MIRRRGKSRASLALIDAAAEILREIQPATVRAVCYRLFVAGLIDNMDRKNTNRVGRLLVDGRESEQIPWEWIVDETREAERTASWDNPEEIIQQAVNHYRKDYWTDQPNWVEIWSEKGTVRGTLAPVLREFGITFRVMHGYSSATTIQSIARETDDSDKPLTVLYVGDHDPSGAHMSEVDLPERLERYGGAVEVRRIALVESDLTADLPSFAAETKSRDPRHQWFVRHYGRQCWELDAMPPPDLRKRVSDAISQLVDWDSWNHSRMVEAAETNSMRNLLEIWKASKLRHASICQGGAP